MNQLIELFSKFKLIALGIFVVVAVNACSGSDSDSDGDNTSDLNCDDAPKYTLLDKEEFATIPAEFATTYTLTFSETAAGSGIDDGAVVEFEVTEDGALIIDGTAVLCNPVLYNDNPAEAIWKDEENDLAYALSSLEDSFNEINVSNNEHSDQGGFEFYGQFTE